MRSSIPVAVVAFQFALSSFHPHLASATDERPREIGGIYPHLAYFNNEGECGTGAVVPWADRLWVITYGPHLPFGSSDKLYEITPDLKLIIRPESVGGTPANRMIHRESQQLFIGPYVIDEKGGVRVVPPMKMPGRLTGTARHLTDPAGKVYHATMEEGLYEMDVKTLAVTGLIKDPHKPPAGKTEEERPATVESKLPGYHGKGLYSGQGRVVYSNNGDRDERVKTDPTTPSGALAEWRKPGEDWQLVRRNQFTEVTGPGGIFGNEKPDTDPIWSVGWDAKSLILMLLDSGDWHSFRLPKASHSYDGAHGWNTEWPRIRDIGESDLLMTMHGTFWKFPRTFTAKNSAGILPRSTYLKVVGDFCRWDDRLVLGCDDTAQKEFLNKRKAKGDLAGPGQSQSNLWFIAPERLDQLGAPLGRGAVWLEEAVKADEPSDPFLFAGYERRIVHVAHDSKGAVTVTFEVDRNGNGGWEKLRSVSVPAAGYECVEFSAEEKGAWIRLRSEREIGKATAFFHFTAPDKRSRDAAPIFAGLASANETGYIGGIARARGENKGTLAISAATVRDGKLSEEAYYELDAALKLARVDDQKAHDFLKKNAEIPRGAISTDAASVLVIDDAGRRWRLPRGDAAFDREGALPLRVDREVCTERDLFNAHGTFYELPADNADGFRKMRPVTTHNRRITDYCSWRGLLVLMGIAANAPADNPRIVRSDDGKCAVWLGAVDDLWQFGKAVGEGGPWKDSAARANEPSDAYLMTGYDRKTLSLSHDAKEPVSMRVEVDIAGTGLWKAYRSFDVPAGENVRHEFPQSFQAYWVRVVAARDCRATAWLVYE